MNTLGIAGIVLLLLGLLIFIAPYALNYIVAIAFLAGGALLAYQGFSSTR
ncbi:MAG: DUF3096 domain-containing protein [Chloroflexota bacterium]|nr:DUF3096 domain-containing protein [Chloroflexota bacterium]